MPLSSSPGRGAHLRAPRRALQPDPAPISPGAGIPVARLQPGSPLPRCTEEKWGVFKSNQRTSGYRGQAEGLQSVCLAKIIIKKDGFIMPLMGCCAGSLLQPSKVLLHPMVIWVLVIAAELQQSIKTNNSFSRGPTAPGRVCSCRLSRLRKHTETSKKKFRSRSRGALAGLTTGLSLSGSGKGWIVLV